MWLFNKTILRTERLILRPLLDSDTESLYGIFSDPNVMRYWSTPPWGSVEQAKAMIELDKVALASGHHLRLGISIRADEKLIGTCSLFSFFEQCKRAEIGYGMSSAVWGNGFMHEALSALISHAFNELNLHRIEADIDPRNAASARSLERLGFLKEGHLRERWIVNEEVSDTALYGLLRSEWERVGPDQLIPMPVKK